MVGPFFRGREGPGRVAGILGPSGPSLGRIGCDSSRIKNQRCADPMSIAGGFSVVKDHDIFEAAPAIAVLEDCRRKWSCRGSKGRIQGAGLTRHPVTKCPSSGNPWLTPRSNEPLPLEGVNLPDGISLHWMVLLGADLAPKNLGTTKNPLSTNRIHAEVSKPARIHAASPLTVEGIEVVIFLKTGCPIVWCPSSNAGMTSHV